MKQDVKLMLVGAAISIIMGLGSFAWPCVDQPSVLMVSDCGIAKVAMLFASVIWLISYLGALRGLKNQSNQLIRTVKAMGWAAAITVGIGLIAGVIVVGTLRISFR